MRLSLRFCWQLQRLDVTLGRLVCLFNAFLFENVLGKLVEVVRFSISVQSSTKQGNFQQHRLLGLFQRLSKGSGIVHGFAQSLHER